MIASCRHFILIFLLFLLCVMAQNAPIHLEEREASGPLRHKTQQFYCTSVLLKNLAKFMVQVQHSVALPSERGNGTYSQESVNLVLQQFNFTCTTFTNAMAIKHQLQYSLFNGGYYMKNNGVIVKINNEEMMKNFTLILEYLQMVGNFLQNIENILTGKYCIEFSASQYEKIYWNLINDDDNISVLNTLQKVRWAVTDDYPKEWPKHSISHSSCSN